MPLSLVYITQITRDYSVITNTVQSLSNDSDDEDIYAQMILLLECNVILIIGRKHSNLSLITVNSPTQRSCANADASEETDGFRNNLYRLYHVRSYQMKTL